MTKLIKKLIELVYKKHSIEKMTKLEEKLIELGYKKHSNEKDAYVKYFERTNSCMRIYLSKNHDKLESYFFEQSCRGNPNIQTLIIFDREAEEIKKEWEELKEFCKNINQIMNIRLIIN